MKYMNNILDLHMNDRVENFGLGVLLVCWTWCVIKEASVVCICSHWYRFNRLCYINIDTFLGGGETSYNIISYACPSHLF